MLVTYFSADKSLKHPPLLYSLYVYVSLVAKNFLMFDFLALDTCLTQACIFLLKLCMLFSRFSGKIGSEFPRVSIVDWHVDAEWWFTLRTWMMRRNKFYSCLVSVAVTLLAVRTACSAICQTTWRTQQCSSLVGCSVWPSCVSTDHRAYSRHLISFVWLYW